MTTDPVPELLPEGDYTLRFVSSSGLRKCYEVAEGPHEGYKVFFVDPLASYRKEQLLRATVRHQVIEHFEVHDAQ